MYMHFLIFCIEVKLLSNQYHYSTKYPVKI